VDGCTGLVTLSQFPGANSTVDGIGDHAVTVTATDAAGNKIDAARR